MALGRFELLVGDQERAAHPAVFADTIKIATLERSIPLALRELVELNQNTLETWADVARMARNNMKIKQAINSTGCAKRYRRKRASTDADWCLQQQKAKAKDKRKSARQKAKAKSKAKRNPKV